MCTLKRTRDSQISSISEGAFIDVLHTLLNFELVIFPVRNLNHSLHLCCCLVLCSMYEISCSIYDRSMCLAISIRFWRSRPTYLRLNSVVRNKFATCSPHSFIGLKWSYYLNWGERHEFIRNGSLIAISVFEPAIWTLCSKLLNWCHHSAFLAKDRCNLFFVIPLDICYFGHFNSSARWNILQ